MSCSYPTQCLRYGLWLSRNRFLFLDTCLTSNSMSSNSTVIQGTLINQLRNSNTVNSHLQHSLTPTQSTVTYSTVNSHLQLSLIHLSLNRFIPSQILPWLKKIIFLVNSRCYPAFIEPEGSIIGHMFQSLDSTKGTSTYSTRPNHTSLTPILT